jgi:hypothetical protein
MPPKPYNSWLLDEETCLWYPPVTYPAGQGKHIWNEETVSWDLAQPLEEPEE